MVNSATFLAAWAFWAVCTAAYRGPNRLQERFTWDYISYAMSENGPPCSTQPSVSDNDDGGGIAFPDQGEHGYGRPRAAAKGSGRQLGGDTASANIPRVDDEYIAG